VVFARSLTLGALALASVTTAVPMGKAQSPAGVLAARGEQCGCTVTVTATVTGGGYAATGTAKTATTKVGTTKSKTNAKSKTSLTSKAATTAVATTKAQSGLSASASSSSSTGSKGSKDCNSSASSAFTSCSAKITTITTQLKEICSVESSTTGASFSLTGSLGSLVGGLIGGTLGAEIEGGASIDASVQVEAIQKLLAEITTEVGTLSSTVAGLEGYTAVSGGVSVATVGHAATVFITDLNALYAALDAHASLSGLASVTASFKSVVNSHVHVCFSALDTVVSGVSSVLSSLLGGLNLSSGLTVSVEAGLDISL